MFKRKVIEESFHMSLVASPSVTVDEIGKVVITFVQGTASCQGFPPSPFVVVFTLLFLLFFPYIYEPYIIKNIIFAPPNSPSLVEELSCGGMFGGGSRGVGAGEGEVKEFLVRNIKIEVASGVSLVPLLFSLPASLRMGVGSESTGRRRGGVRMSVFASDPYYIVAITNQSQWLVANVFWRVGISCLIFFSPFYFFFFSLFFFRIDAENKLLIRELYRGEDHTTGFALTLFPPLFSPSHLPPFPVEWCFFVNCLHSRFLQATKQKDSDPSRPFSLSDLKYFHQKFFNSSQGLCFFWQGVWR